MITKRELLSKIYRLEQRLELSERLIKNYLGVVYSEREMTQDEIYNGVKGKVLDFGMIKELIKK